MNFVGTNRLFVACLFLLRSRCGSNRTKRTAKEQSRVQHMHQTVNTVHICCTRCMYAKRKTHPKARCRSNRNPALARWHDDPATTTTTTTTHSYADVQHSFPGCGQAIFMHSLKCSTDSQSHGHSPPMLLPSVYVCVCAGKHNPPAGQHSRIPEAPRS